MIDASCTDCSAGILRWEHELSIRAKNARLCDSCREERTNGKGSLDTILPSVLGNYCVNVELQWAISEKDLEYRAVGDMETDFARRSLQSIRTALETVAGCGHDTTPIGHYSIDIASLRRCMGQPIKERPGGHLKQYHDALNGLLSKLPCIEVQDGLFQDVFKALAIGTRKGWDVDPEFVKEVVAEESNDVPMSEEEARSRFGL